MKRTQLIAALAGAAVLVAGTALYVVGTRQEPTPGLAFWRPADAPTKPRGPRA